MSSRNHLWLPLIVITATTAVASLTVGPGGYGLADVWSALTQPNALLDPHLHMVISELRGPRMLAACLVGGAMGLAATLLQSATRNPLAEPGLMGVNSGAVLGVVVGIIYSNVESTHGYLLWAALGALVGNAVVLLISFTRAEASPLRLLLAGLALSASLGGIANYLLLSHQVALEQFRFWNMGSLAAAELSALVWVLPAVLFALVLSLLLARALTLMQLGDSQAVALGIRPTQVRIGVLVASTLLVASAIAVAGPISFVGLLAAYCARWLQPVSLNGQVLYSILLGMLLLLISDILARTLIQPYEFPNGVLLALIGAPLLILIVRSGGFRALLIARSGH